LVNVDTLDVVTREIIKKNFFKYKEKKVFFSHQAFIKKFISVESAL